MIEAVYLMPDGEVDHPTWDYCRYKGDTQIAREYPFDWKYSNAEGEMCRPLDFDQATEWIKNNIEDVYQQRWLDIFEDMKVNSNLYFKFS